MDLFGLLDLFGSFLEYSPEVLTRKTRGPLILVDKQGFLGIKVIPTCLDRPGTGSLVA